MNQKEYETVKIKLNRYRELRGRVSRLAEEAARWNAMAELSAPELRRSGGGSCHRDMGAMKTFALSVEEERDRAAEAAMAERRRLMESIARIGDAASRDILERIYIGGATVRETADALGVSEKTVLRKLRKAAALFREQAGP